MRKICVVTGSRAEYGLLYWLIKEIQDDPELELQIVVTGMHLSPEFGLTYKNIEEDGFNIDAEVEMLLSGDTPASITKSIGLGTIGFADVLERLKPEIVVVLGDRYEILAAVQAAMVARIPIAHLHGGEITEGAIDEAIRHAVTKIAHLHFVAAEPYRKRVIQLGEDPNRVFNFGAPGLDNVSKLNLLDLKDFQQAIGFRLGKINFLVTYHSVTLRDKGPKETMIELFSALDNFQEARIIFTKQNADPEGKTIGRMIDEYVSKNPKKTIAYTSLGQIKYLSALKHVDVVIGNSSSGLIEAPAMKRPTVNIGPRQQGRLKASSVIDCDENSNSIIKAIKKALSSDFRKLLPNVISLYGSGNTSFRIKEILKVTNLDGILFKKFYNITMYEFE